MQRRALLVGWALVLTVMPSWAGAAVAQGDAANAAPSAADPSDAVSPDEESPEAKTEEDDSPDDDRTDEENPWVDGPEAPTYPPFVGPVGDAQPPRGPGAEQSPIDQPLDLPEPRTPWFDPGLQPDAPDVRMTTYKDRDEVFQFGDLNLADALIFLPGIWWPQIQAASPLPSARGLPTEHLGVRVDGVPVLPTSGFPSFPVLAHVPLSEVQRVRLRHGPRAGLGLEGAAAGALDIETLPRPKDLGEAGVVTGRARVGYGGPDLEKAVFLRGETGIKRARLTVAGGGFHRERLRLGRGAGLHPNSYGLGGYLHARADVVPYRGLRVWAGWTSSRQARTPVPSQCEEDEFGRFEDCVVAHDRARDALVAGIDTRHGLFDFAALSTRTRAHVQRFSEDWVREGRNIGSRDLTVTEIWRGGALSEARLSLRPFQVWQFTLTPEVAAGLEGLRDRALSGQDSFSQFSRDLAIGTYEVPDRMPIASGGTRTQVRSYARASLRSELFSLRAEGTVANTRVSIVRPDLARMEGRLVGHSAVTFSGELSARAHLGSWASVFVAALRSDRPGTLFELGRGPERFEGQVPLPALPGTSRFYEHALELGGDVDLTWLQVSGLIWAADRSGALTAGTFAPELASGREVIRVVRTPRRQGAGVEGRARWQTPFDGLSAEGTFAAVALDEGVFFREPSPFAPSPVAGVPRPTGAAALHWAPRDWPIHVFGRARYALPQARLSEGEELDEALCPQGLIDPQVQPCQGIFGYALYDIGMSFSPSQNFRVEGIATNLMDAPTTLRISPFPGGGLAARATATLQF